MYIYAPYISMAFTGFYHCSELRIDHHLATEWFHRPGVEDVKHHWVVLKKGELKIFNF